MACKKRIAVLIPDEAGIIHAERLPNSTNSYTFGDARKSLFDSALYVEQCAREYLNAQPADIDAANIDAMQNLIDKGKYLRSLIDDEEINKLPVPLLEKIWGLALSAHFVGKMEELAIIAPILSKEQIIRELYSKMQGGFAAAEKDRDEKASAAAEKLETIQETIEDRNRQKQERPRITQRQAAEYILRAETRANITNRSFNLDSIIRRVKTWDLYIKTSGERGVCPPAGYSRYIAPESFATWARDILVRDERFNKSNRDK